MCSTIQHEPIAPIKIAKHTPHITTRRLGRVMSSTSFSPLAKSAITKMRMSAHQM